MITWYFNMGRWKLFTGIVSVNLLIILLSQKTLLNEVVFYNTYSEQLTWERAVELFNRFRSLSWAGYLMTPVILLLKFSAITTVIYTGAYLMDYHQRLTPGRIFAVVIASEAVFVLAAMVKLFWFIFFAGNYTLDDLRFFYPLSLVNFFSSGEVAGYWIYPLQTVNLFQVIYLLMLSAGLAVVSQSDRNSTDRLVASTYLPAMAIWIALIMFVSIDTM